MAYITNGPRPRTSSNMNPTEEIIDVHFTTRRNWCFATRVLTTNISWWGKLDFCLGFLWTWIWRRKPGPKAKKSNQFPTQHGMNPHNRYPLYQSVSHLEASVRPTVAGRCGPETIQFSLNVLILSISIRLKLETCCFPYCKWYYLRMQALCEENDRQVGGLLSKWHWTSSLWKLKFWT